jgi:hypothetical protein
MDQPAVLFLLILSEDTWLELFNTESASILFELTDRNRSYLRKWLPWLDNYRCAVGNLPSQKIAQRLGFSFTAIKKDAEWLYDHSVDQLVYTMHAHDWLKQYPKVS